ncbi:hypothetical protein K435DRAFT_851456 [Dendrothele bispora CBS 962.96]|uniref:Uncharacterized protein n=1 Tax=Dendrothele bispora (strain CBS 962.96) TaxID=1314807 RepID=A0A4S8MLY8_DENBC|nr:hypothetical protein K435DRAFT_851456 [Dendrothele bispora CBS 962.96]
MHAMLMRSCRTLLGLRQHRPFSASSSRRFPENEASKDFRPPWVYTAVRLGLQWSIPAIGLYAIFWYDFGPSEHVFSPARRWAARQKAAFFTLSPEERKLTENKEHPTSKA